jgi:Protein of unknown function (DUF2950)
MSSLKYGLVITMSLALAFVPACSKGPSQTEFATPDEAANALLKALKADSVDSLRAIFGRDAMIAAGSGDAVSDRQDRELVTVAMEQSWRWGPRGADKKELIIGDEQWPFPAPLVKKGDRWQFDSAAGVEEVLARRIGRNELGIIDVCLAYVDMQKEYATQPHDGQRAGLFAQHLRSTSGKQDGLYWAAKPGEKSSPMGDLAAEAAVEGYDTTTSSSSVF